MEYESWKDLLWSFGESWGMEFKRFCRDLMISIDDINNVVKDHPQILNNDIDPERVAMAVQQHLD